MRVVAFRPALLPLLLLLLPLLQGSAALYYKPRPLVCPVTQDVEYVDETLEATQLDLQVEPFLVKKVTLNTVYESRVLPVTNVVLHTVTAAPQQVDVTEVQVVRETLPLTVAKVSSVTREVVDTSISLYTITATNYKTDFQTLSALKTRHATATTLETIWLPTTITQQTTNVSTVTVSAGALRTSLRLSTIPRTVTADTFTHIETRQVIYTHTLTKMITSTVCLATDV